MTITFLILNHKKKTRKKTWEVQLKDKIKSMFTRGRDSIWFFSSTMWAKPDWRLQSSLDVEVYSKQLTAVNSPKGKFRGLILWSRVNPRLVKNLKKSF